MPPVMLDAGTIAILPRNDAASAREPERPVAGGRRARSAASPTRASTTYRPGPTDPRPRCGAGSWAPPSAAITRCSTRCRRCSPSTRRRRGQWLDSSMRFLAEQQPSSEVVARLSELFLAQAVREYVDRLPAGASGWLRGPADPAVSKALSIIHRATARISTSRSWRARPGFPDRCSGNGSSSCLASRRCDIARAGGCGSRRTCFATARRIAPTSLMRSGSTARRRSTARSSANMAFRRRPGAGRSRTRRSRREGARRSRASREPPPERGHSTAPRPDGTRLAYAVAGDGLPAGQGAQLDDPSRA